MPTRLDRHAALFLLGALSIVALASAVSMTGIADIPFYTKGEPREAMVAWEMSHGGSLVLPLRNGTEIPSKPPFFHWLALLSATVGGGVTELTARLPSALLSIVAALAVFAFGAATGRIRSGWLAASALLLSFEWLRAARIARVDMTLTVFLFGALLCFAVIQRSGVTRLRLLIFYACMAAATLGKGPVGIVLPLLVIAVFAAVSPGEDGARRGLADRARHVLATMRSLDPVRGLTVVLLVVGAWYAAAIWIGGNDFLVKQVLKENLFRVIDPERYDSGHRHGPFYFVSNFLVGALPWSLLAPAVVWWLWRMRPLDATTRYLIVWFLTVIAFFSISSSKRSVYILPAYPAAALLLGRVLGPGPEGDGPRRLASWGMIAGAFVAAVLGAAGVILALGIPVAGLIVPLLEPHDAQGLLAAVDSLNAHRWLALAAAAGAIAGAVGAIRLAPGAHWLRGGACLTVAMALLYGGVIAPVERGVAISRTLKPFLAEVRQRVGSDELGFLCTFDYGAVFYSQLYFPPTPFARRCPAGGRCRDHIRELIEDEGRCSDPANLRKALHRPDTPPYVLVWESEAAKVDGDLEIVSRSVGTGPKGRESMLLATVRPSPPGG